MKTTYLRLKASLLNEFACRGSMSRDVYQLVGGNVFKALTLGEAVANGEVTDNVTSSLDSVMGVELKSGEKFTSMDLYRLKNIILISQQELDVYFEVMSEEDFNAQA